MTPATSPPWESLAKAYINPTALRIVQQALQPAPNGDPGWSASSLSDALGERLGNVAYHVRSLADRGVLERSGERKRRAVIESFYTVKAAA